MFDQRNKGKIIIHIENEDGKINSTMEFQGIAKQSEVTLTSLLVNFASLAMKKGKDPKNLIDKHLTGILEMLDSIQGGKDL